MEERGTWYRFGDFELQPANRLLVQAGRRIDLPAKALDTLIILVRNAGHLVSKDQLLTEVWPDALVEENYVSVNIAKLRSALGETAREWSYIETVPRFGYRFTAHVEVIDDGTRIPLSSTGRSVGDSPRRLRRVSVAAVSVAVATLVVSLVILNHDDKPETIGIGSSGFASQSDSRAAEREYTLGTHFWARRTMSDVQRSVEHFHRAVRYYPLHAPSHAALARSYVLMGWYGNLPPVAVFPRALAAAERALSIDASLADAHAVRALYNWQYAFDRVAAQEAFEDAVRADSANSTVRQWFGEFLAYTGRFSEGVYQLDRALELDPLSSAAAMDLGTTYLLNGDPSEALRRYDRLLEIEPDFAVAHVFRGMALSELGRHDESIASHSHALMLVGRQEMWSMLLAEAHARAGNHEGALQLMSELDLETGNRYVSPFARALVYEALGDRMAAIDQIMVALKIRDSLLVFLTVLPQLRDLRHDPDFWYAFDDQLRELEIDRRRAIWSNFSDEGFSD
jgi:DNA-binding winged helix-turn-helix (wHTH) protein/Flp pilus assembly protein TadD